MTKNLTVNLIDDAAHEINVNFDIEIYNDIPADRHPDDTSTSTVTYYENATIKSVELVVCGIGVNITNQYLEALKMKPTAKTKIENQLCELTPELLED